MFSSCVNRFQSILLCFMLDFYDAHLNMVLTSIRNFKNISSQRKINNDN